MLLVAVRGAHIDVATHSFVENEQQSRDPLPRCLTYTSHFKLFPKHNYITCIFYHHNHDRRR